MRYQVRLLAVVAAATLIQLAATPASAVVISFATFSDTASNLRWVNSDGAADTGSGGSLFSITTPSSAGVGSTSVNFSFINVGIAADVTNVTASFTLNASAPTGNPATTVGPFLKQGGIGGSFSFITTSAIFIPSTGTFYAAGSNLLSGTFGGASILALGAGGIFGAATSAGDTLVLTSDFLDFAATTYFDGQGFLAPKALGLTTAAELSGARICVQAGAASQDNLAEYFRARGLTYKPVVVASEAEARKRYENDGCDVFTADISALAGSRSVLNNPGAHVILPDVISKEPLGPVVRQNDPVWADIVRWTVYATILGEELGLSSKTVLRIRETSVDPQTRRLLGVDGDYGLLLGLKKDWAFQVIRQVGAYDEIFRRDVGADSALKLDRGMNALWTAPKPGLLYAPPFR